MLKQHKSYLFPKIKNKLRPFHGRKRGNSAFPNAVEEIPSEGWLNASHNGFIAWKSVFTAKNTSKSNKIIHIFESRFFCEILIIIINIFYFLYPVL